MTLPDWILEIEKETVAIRCGGHHTILKLDGVERLIDSLKIALEALQIYSDWDCDKMNEEDASKTASDAIEKIRGKTKLS